jgi:hypothetical protein
MTRAAPSYVAIDYINSQGSVRSHLVPAGTMRTLCGITIEGERGALRGFEYPATSKYACNTCPRYAAFYASKESA